MEEFKKKDLMEGKLLKEDGWENALMVAGFVPVIGEVADIILIARYLWKGEYLYAAIMLIALIPTVGDFIAKPFIRILKSSGAGKLALKGADEMAEYLAKNPNLKKEYIKMGKYFDHPGVKKTIESVSKVSSSTGKKMAQSVSEAKSVLGKLRPTKMVKRVGQEISAGGKFSKGLKSFFQEEKLAQYIAKTGSKPTTWLSNWWNVVRAGRKARKDMFRSILISSNVLHTLGLPSLKNDSDIERLLNDPKYANAIANDPQISSYINSNTDPSEVGQVENMGNVPSGGGMSKLEMAFGLKTLKALANMYV